MKKFLSAMLVGSMVVMSLNTAETKAHVTEAEIGFSGPIRFTTTTQPLNDMDVMKQNYIRYMCGDEELNKNALVQSKITSINSTAKKALDAFIEKDGDRSKGIFKNLDLTVRDNSNAFSTTAKNLQSIAIAYATPGSNYYKDEDVKNKVIDGLEAFYLFFNDADLLQQYFGNWYNWEIAIPTSLSSLFVLMEEEINAVDSNMIPNYVRCMDLYLQNGKDGDVDLNSRFHTGANLADITMNRVLQGIVTKDEGRIEKAVSNMMSVYAVIDPNNIVHNNTDGVYEDGSFIQHHRVAYTGSYGITLLQRIAQSIIVLGGSQYQPENYLDTVQKWIYESFTPVTFEGYMMEIVKGRGVSRTTTGYADMGKIIDSMLQVLPYLNEKDAQGFKEHLKYLVTSMPINQRTKSSSLSLISIVEFENIMADDSIKAISHSPLGHYALNSMDKNVHVRDGYAFSISRSSNRIAKYEYMSGENKRSWFQGDGAFYLYLSGRDQVKSYGAEYYAASGAYHLPGTTVPIENRQTIQEWYGKDYYDNSDLGFESGSEKQNDYVYFPVGTNHYSGSVKLDGYGAAGMQLGDDNAYADKQKGLLPDDFVVYKNAEANKAWFMFDDEIVVMSSGIHDELGRQLISTIDNRMSDTTEQTTVVLGYSDGNTEALTTNGIYKNLSWISYGTDQDGTNVGYYFPQVKDITIENGPKTGNLRDVRSKNTNKNVTHNFFTLTYDHGSDPKNDAYSYVILPNADATATEKYAENPQIIILANNEQVQAVEHLGLKMKGYMFYGQAEVGGIRADSCASILTKQENDTFVYAISDPTFEQSVIDITVNIKNAEIVSGGENITIEHKGATSILHVNVEKANGKTFEVTLREKDMSALIDELDTWIADSEKLNKEEYTEETWIVFEQALKNAKAIASNEFATVEEIEDAIEQLANAKAGLKVIEKNEEKPDDGNVDKPKPEEPQPEKPQPENPSDSVNTEDSSHIAMYIGLMIAIVFCSLTLISKKFKYEE